MTQSILLTYRRPKAEVIRLARERGGDDALKALAVYNDGRMYAWTGTMRIELAERPLLPRFRTILVYANQRGTPIAGSRSPAGCYYRLQAGRIEVRLKLHVRRWIARMKTDSLSANRGMS
jgi:hypothetical protein